jgi:superfamily I DNA and/or RNA helicase
MNKNRKKLLDLIENLKLPLAPQQAKKTVGKLSDEEVELLVSAYKDVKEGQQTIEEIAKLIAPKKFEKIEKEYHQKMANLDEEYLQEMEKIQKESDEELDALEEKAGRKLDEAIQKQDSEIDGIERLHDDLYAKLNSSISG